MFGPDKKTFTLPIQQGHVHNRVSTREGKDYYTCRYYNRYTLESLHNNVSELRLGTMHINFDVVIGDRGNSDGKNHSDGD